jgi:recombinational DNA repair ATPase RecF
MKVKAIQFYDYRAFFNGENEQYLINVDQKNILIYGENGSGKTSLYKGVKDFIDSNDFTSHNQAKLLNAGFVEIQFDDESAERFDATGTKPIKAEVLNTSKLNSFLSYKELLRTHFVDTEEINLFDLLINGILSEHSLSTLGQLKLAWTSEKAKNIDNEVIKLNEALEKGDIDEEEKKEQIDITIENLEQEITKFSDELTTLLKQINEQLKRTLTYFNQNLDVELKLEPIKAKNLAEPKIRTEVKYFGRPISTHHEFLNEARLSALAISIYLAAIKLNPTKNTLQLLFLDDVFLGLDLGNRLPLLEILEKEFNDWQIFLTTYDKHWFEVAK